ncbi:MAG: Hsp20/alpha crystallin family protein [Methylacidiphilales bacterium]|nr:Hsp20/alpha crystallin family protein [Candidatus Methylacidiphilales bacterium]
MKLIRYHNSPSYIPSVSYPGLREEMDRLFDVAFPALSSLQSNGFFGEWQGEFPVDLYQDKDAFTVRAELPGFRKEDISVEVADGILTVTGHQKTETKSEKKDKEAATTTQERRVSRSVSLPEHLNLDKIQAAYENGVLTVTLPKTEEAKPRQIAVEVK